MHRVLLFLLCFMCSHAYAGVASSGYVGSAIATHKSDVENPHSVTAAQVGLGSVKNVDTTNAENITSGKLNTERLSVGTATGTVAAGDDARFNTIATYRPSGIPPAGMVWVWFE